MITDHVASQTAATLQAILDRDPHGLLIRHSYRLAFTATIDSLIRRVAKGEFPVEVQS